MKIGIKNIHQDGHFGMPLSHLQAFLQTAATHNIVIGIRPINKFALSFIADGHPTKPYAVKNKSSNLGIAAGLIVMDPEYCQVSDQEYKKYFDLLNEAFNKDADLIPIPCILSKNRLNELKKLAGDTFSIEPGSQLDTLLISWQKNGKAMQVTAKKCENSSDYAIYSATNEPLQILGKKIVDAEGKQSTKAVTADYDLLVICPTYQDHNPQGKDKTPFSTQAPLQNIYSIIQESASPNYAGPKEDAKGGNWSERTKEVVGIINKNIATLDPKRKGINLETIHHNCEFHNPFADHFARNLPCLITLPKKMDLSSIDNTAADEATIVMIESQEELQKLCELINQNEYYWPQHASFAIKQYKSNLI